MCMDLTDRIHQPNLLMLLSSTKKEHSTFHPLPEILFTMSATYTLTSYHLSIKYLPNKPIPTPLPYPKLTYSGTIFTLIIRALSLTTPVTWSSILYQTLPYLSFPTHESAQHPSTILDGKTKKNQQHHQCTFPSYQNLYLLHTWCRNWQRIPWYKTRLPHPHFMYWTWESETPKEHSFWN